MKNYKIIALLSLFAGISFGVMPLVGMEAESSQSQWFLSKGSKTPVEFKQEHLCISNTLQGLVESEQSSPENPVNIGEVSHQSLCFIRRMAELCQATPEEDDYLLIDYLLKNEITLNEKLQRELQFLDCPQIQKAFEMIGYEILQPMSQSKESDPISIDEENSWAEFDEAINTYENRGEKRKIILNSKTKIKKRRKDLEQFQLFKELFSQTDCPTLDNDSISLPLDEKSFTRCLKILKKLESIEPYNRKNCILKNIQKYNFNDLIKLAHTADYLKVDDIREVMVDQMLKSLSNEDINNNFFGLINENYVVEQELKSKIINFLKARLKELAIVSIKNQTSFSLHSLHKRGFMISNAGNGYYSYDNPTQKLFNIECKKPTMNERSYIKDNISYYAQESPNGQYFAYHTYPTQYEHSYNDLVVHDRTSGGILYMTYSQNTERFTDFSKDYKFIKAPPKLKSFIFSPDGKSILIVFGPHTVDDKSSEQGVYELNLATGSLSKIMPFVASQFCNQRNLFIWSSNGEKVCSIRATCSQTTISCADTETKKVTHIKSQHHLNNKNVAFTSDGSSLIYQSAPQIVTIHKIPTKNKTKSNNIQDKTELILPQPAREIMGISCSTDGNSIAIVYRDNSNAIHLTTFNTTFGECIKDNDITPIINPFPNPYGYNTGLPSIHTGLIEVIDYSSSDKKIALSQKLGKVKFHIFDSETLDLKYTIGNANSITSQSIKTFLKGEVVLQQGSVPNHIKISIVYDQDILEEHINQLTFEQLVFLFCFSLNAKTFLTPEESTIYESLPEFIRNIVGKLVLQKNNYC